LVIVGIGEVLWDVFPDGPRFGGAPANFACHAAALGGEVSVVSRVGEDSLGEQAIVELQRRGVDTRMIATSASYPTGTVQVELDQAGIPQYEISTSTAWDHLEWSDRLEHLASKADGVCFGTLGQRGETSRQTIRRFLQATRPSCLRIFDVNLRQDFHDESMISDSLELANVLKLNVDELPVVAAIDGFTGSEVEVLRNLRNRYKLHLVALTRGARGAMLSGEDEISECKGKLVEVRDTVGAGDAFTATLAIGLLREQDLNIINGHACQVAAFVCSQAGATPPLPGREKGTAL